MAASKRHNDSIDNITEETDSMLEGFEQKEINDLQQRLQSEDTNHFISLLSKLKQVESQYNTLKQQYVKHVHQIEDDPSKSIHRNTQITISFDDKSTVFSPPQATPLSLASVQQFTSNAFKPNIFWLQYTNEDAKTIVIHDDNDLSLAIQCAQLHHNNVLNIAVIQYSDKHIPFHRYTVADVCALITQWMYTDMNHKSHLAKTKAIFNQHALNGQKMIYLSGDDAKRIVKDEMLQFVTVNTLDIMFDGFNEWQKDHRDHIMLKSAEQIGYILYHYPLKQLMKHMQMAEMNGAKMIEILKDETNDMIQRITGWNNDEIEQIQLICLKRMTFTKQEFIKRTESVLVNTEDDIPSAMLDTIKTSLVEDADIDVEQIQFDIKHNHKITSFSDKIINLVDGLLTKDDESELITRIYTKIAHCFSCNFAADMPREWVCSNCNNCNVSTCIDGKVNYDVHVCVLCGTTEVESIVMKIRHYDTFVTAQSDEPMSVKKTDQMDEIDELIQSVISANQIDLVCLSINARDKVQCPSILRLAKQLMAYNQWLKTIKVYDFKSTVAVDVAQYVDEDAFKNVFMECVRSIKQLTQEDIECLRVMMDQSIDNISDVRTFLDDGRKSFAVKIKQYTKLRLSFGYRLYIRINRLLKYKAHKAKFGEFISELDMDAIDKDYHHILNAHVHNGDKNSIKNVFRFFQHVVHYQDTDSNVEALQCRSVKRRREAATSNDKQTQEQGPGKTSKDIWMLQQYYNQHQLDVIHSYLVHSNWKYFVQRYGTNNAAEDGNTDDDPLSKEEGKEMEMNMETDAMVTADAAAQKSKFTSDSDSYGFGVDHSYPHLTDIHCSIQDELVLNTLYPLSVAHFQNLLIKAIKTHEIALSKGYKEDLICKYFNSDYNILRNEPIQIRHILALIIYTDLTQFCTVLRQTYRKKDDESEDEQVSERHQQLYHYSRSLFEAVEFYGHFMEPNLTVYHGLNKVLYFNHFTAYFYQPISTTTSLQVANQFSDGRGIILSLKSGTSAQDMDMEDMIPKYLNVSWLSNFPHEDEKLFYGGYEVFQITNIIESATLTGHVKELFMFNKFQQMIQNHKVEWNTKHKLEKKMIKALVTLIEFEQNNNDNSSDEIAFPQAIANNKLITKYGMNLFHYFCTNNDTTKVEIKNVKSLPSEIYNALFTAKKNNKISFIPITKVFKWLKEITLTDLKNGQFTKESKYYVDAAMQCIQKSQTKLRKITLQSERVRDRKTNTTLKKLANYNVKKFKKLKWKIEYDFREYDTHMLVLTKLD
eukprot:970870_1